MENLLYLLILVPSGLYYIGKKINKCLETPPPSPPTTQRRLSPVPEVIESIYDNSHQHLVFTTSRKIGSGEWSVCSICLEPMCEGQEIQLLNCGHLFHNKCLSDWLVTKLSENNKVCPLCNNPL